MEDDLLTDNENEREFECKKLSEPKDYLEIVRESRMGKQRTKLILAHYDLKMLEADIRREYIIPIGAGEKAKLNKIFTKTKDIVAYIDGSCIKNPGMSGAGVVFFSRTLT